MRIALITLGCDKNTVDNEYLAGLLEDGGAEIASEVDENIDAAVVTTCGFIGDAKAQSVEAIVGFAEQKRLTGHPERLFVAGCLSQRYADELLHEIPEIDGIVGVGQFETLARMILEGPANRDIKPSPSVEVCRFLRRRRLDAKPYAFLKIADGCNYACSFCSIPRMKGPLHSVPQDILLREAQSLLTQGVRELNLVAQDICAYGLDRGTGERLPQLLRALCAIDGDFWIRCLYCYPGGITDELIDIIAAEPKIVPYLDLPLQHFDSDLLFRMKRPSHDINAFELVRRLRDAIPGLTLRTTVLVGFPGETPQAHRRMLEAIRALAFDRLGAFQYSREEGTSAAEMPRQVGARTRETRWRAVMELQSEVAAGLNRKRIGQHVRVLLDEYDALRKQWSARSAAEAPEVDGCVWVKPTKDFAPGQFISVEITGADVYDVQASVATLRSCS